MICYFQEFINPKKRVALAVLFFVKQVLRNRADGQFFNFVLFLFSNQSIEKQFHQLIHIPRNVFLIRGFPIPTQLIFVHREVQHNYLFSLIFMNVTFLLSKCDILHKKLHDFLLSIALQSLHQSTYLI